MKNFLKYTYLCLIPIIFMLPGCGLMVSVGALLPPVENGSADTTFRFRIYDSAWDDDGTDYVYFGIELYYRIFTGPQSGGVISLSYSSQLAGNGFRRMHRAGDETDDFIKPVLCFEDVEIGKYEYQYFKTSGYTYVDMECYFDDITGMLTVTIKDDGGTVLETFELKRAVSFPEGHASGEEYQYKGFDDFEQNDADISSTIWDNYINALPPVNVTLMLYAFSYGFSLDPNHMWAQIESPLEYIGQLDVMCKKYE
ncbi:MAG: hypothetical protein JW822_10665 [Spirochaetales bacterium]|nr:hypothetical protein [Spirochaetales bacterium]